MQNKVSQKRNLSSIQVIKTLKILMQGNYSMNELIDILNEKEADALFNNSVISKYINTCRYCGLEIPKINNKYYVANIPFGLNLSQLDIDLLLALQGYVKDEMSAKYSKIADTFMEKIEHFSNKKIAAANKTKYNYCIELFERAIAKKCKINLIFKNQKVLECIPKSITQKGNKTFLNVYNKRIRNIDFSRLSGLEISRKRYIEPFDGNQEVVFKLTGALAKRYEARNNEQVILNNDGTITVTNKNENKELLFSRLLRYDDKCEILKPKEYREEMKILINAMLSVYEEG